MSRIPVIALIMMLVTAACSHDSRLDRADALMYPESDKALALLDSIDPADLRGQADRARYALLYSKAQNKCHIFPTSDSLINIAVSYYDHSGHDSLRMLAHLYRSVIRNSASAHHSALRDGLLAKDIAEQLNMPYWVARASQEIADAYYQSYDMDNAIRYSDIAARNFTLTGYHLNSHYVTVDKALSLSHRGHYSEAVQILDSLSNFIDSTDLNITTYVWIGYIRPLNALNRSAEAIEYARKTMELEPDMFYDPMIDYADIAISYMQTGQIDSAEYYLKIAEDRNTPAAPYAKVWHLAKIKDYEGAFELMRTYNSKHSAMLNDFINNNIAIEEKEFLVKKKESELRESRLRHAVMILILALTVIVLLYARLYSLRKRRYVEQRLFEVSATVDELMSSNQALTHELSDANKLISEDCGQKDLYDHITESLFKKQFESISLLCDKYYDKYYNKYHRPGSATADLTRELEQQLQFIVSDVSVENMRKIIDHYSNGKLTSLTQLIELKHDELTFLTLIIAGFSTRSVCVLMKIEYPTYYTKRRRLKEKLQRIDSLIVKDYLDILSKGQAKQLTISRE